MWRPLCVVLYRLILNPDSCFCCLWLMSCELIRDLQIFSSCPDEQQEMKVRGDKDGQTEVREGLCESQPTSSDTQLLLIGFWWTSRKTGNRIKLLSWCLSSYNRCPPSCPSKGLHSDTTAMWTQVLKWPDIAVTNSAVATMTKQLPWRRSGYHGNGVAALPRLLTCRCWLIRCSAALMVPVKLFQTNQWMNFNFSPPASDQIFCPPIPSHPPPVFTLMIQ